MRKVLFLFADAAVIVGGVIGAGFASGEEVALYFYGKNALLSSAVAFVVFFAVFYVFLSIGRKFAELENNVGNSLADKPNPFVAKASRVFLNFNYFAVLCSMLAGANVTLSALFATRSIHFVFGAATAAICGLILFFDMKGIRRFSNFVVPFIVVLIVSVCLLNSEYGTVQGKGGAGSAFLYVSMNCVIMSGVLLGIGGERKANGFWLSLISSFVLSALSDYTARQLCRQLRDNAAALLRLSGRLGNGRAYERGYIFLHSYDGYSLRVSACRMADAVAQIQGFCVNRRVLFRFGGVPCRFFRYSRLCLSLNFRFGRVGYSNLRRVSDLYQTLRKEKKARPLTGRAFFSCFSTLQGIFPSGRRPDT